MSNSIWKTPDDYNYGEDYEVKDEAIVVDTGDGEYWAYSSFYYMPHHCDDPDCCFADTECWKRWAKVTDLIAQADKAERLQKAVDVAEEALKYARQRGLDNTATLFAVGTKADKALDEIRQLIKENQ